jgi:hypothetical protein
MTVYIDVARYHLVQRLNYLILPWAIVGFIFVLNLFIIASVTSAGDDSRHYVGGLGSIFVLLFALGVQSVARSLPFGLALGISRRSYYLGTALLAAVLAAVASAVITVAQAVERATGGWGLDLGFFRVPYILNGPWYLTWLTSFVGLTLLFVYGMWFGLVYRRWSLVGLVSFVAAQVTVLTIAALVVTTSHGWHDLGHFFTSLSAAGLTGLLAVLTVVLFAGGFATMRRVTV